MHIEKLNQWLMLAANVGVLGGMLFLAFEIRQNTSQMRTDASHSITELVNALNADTYSDPEFAELFIRGNQDFNSLDTIDRHRYQSYQFSRLNLAEYILLLEEEGLTDVQFPYVEYTVNDFRRNPGAMAWVRSIEDVWVGSEELWNRITGDTANR